MAINPGDRVRVTREFIVGRNDGWRLVVDDLDRTAIVIEGATVEILEKATVSPKVGDPFTTGLPKGAVVSSGGLYTILRTAEGWRSESGYLFTHESSLSDTAIVYLPEGVK